MRRNKIGIIGNDDPFFSPLAFHRKKSNLLKYNIFSKLARHLLYIWHNNNNKPSHNKNKT